MRHQSKSYYISAFKSNATASQNIDAHNALRTMLLNRSFQFIEVIGTYNGIPELTFIVSNENNDTEEYIKTYARIFRQESILIVHSIDSTSELVFINDDTRKVIGNMKRYDGETVQLKGNDYTYYQPTNSYYIVE